MTNATKTISSYYSNGYILAQNTNLYITPTGGVGGLGILTDYAGETITNYGFVDGHSGTGAYFNDGGDLVNGSGFYSGAVLEGHAGVKVFGAAGTVTNFGSILGSRDQGVVLYAGGNVINGAPTDTTALIKAQFQGVGLVQVGTVSNYGAIEAVGAARTDVGVELNAGGRVYNGARFNGPTNPSISGYTGVLLGGAGTVFNQGTIAGLPGIGVELNSGGKVFNGYLSAGGASIRGVIGVSVSGGSGTVDNYGSITGADGVRLTSGGAVDNLGVIDGQDFGVYILGGGTVINGATGDSTATIAGGALDPVFFQTGSGAGTVTNFGTLTSSGSDGVYLGSGGAVSNFGAIAAGHTGVLSKAGGIVTNGSGANHGATIEGDTGIDLTGASGAVTNLGTIEGMAASGPAWGVYLGAGGDVTNGAANDRTALISGYTGLEVTGGSATVVNSGTILGAGPLGGFGVEAFGGTLINGSRAHGGATIEGYYGVKLGGAGTATNFGTIAGQGDRSAGVTISATGVVLTNGASGHGAALIEGYLGVSTVASNVTVINYGTIEGTGSFALGMTAGDTLIVEAGSAFIGGVLGARANLDLATGVGTLTGLSGGYVTVSGSMAATTFDQFKSIEVGGSFTDTQSASIAAGDTLIAAGALNLGSLVNGGTLSVAGGILNVNGAVSGTGHVIITGGTADFTSAFSQNVTFGAGVATLELAKSQTYAGTISGFSKTGAMTLDLADIAFGGSTKASYAGTTTSGTLTVTDGTRTAHIKLSGNYLSSTFTVSSDGHGGTDVIDPKAKAMVGLSSPHRLIAAMAGLAAEAPLSEPLQTPWRAAAPMLVFRWHST